MSNPSQLSILTTLGIDAVKTYKMGESGVEVEGYGRAKNFTADRIDIDERGAWLKALRKERYSFVVLGDVKGWEPGQRKRRMSVDRDGEEATIVDVPRLWMPVDVDQVDFEPISKIDDGEGFALELMDRLGVRGTRCVWHLTNSHGFFDKYRARLWLRLKEPMTCEEMKAYASRWSEITVEVKGKAKAMVDLAVYRPAQPIYTGDPVLEGVDPPVKRRVGFLDGDPLVAKDAEPKRKKKRGAPEDENVARLEDAGLYIRRLKPGQHCVECPWEDEHTGEPRDDDTFYFEPHFNGHDIPAFKCHHGSCEGRKWEDVIDHLGIKATSFAAVEDDRDEDPDEWVYVHRLESFWDPRDGNLVSTKAYDSTHGGKGKKGTPTDRFLLSPKTKKADTAEFLPGRRRIVRKNGMRVLNTYVDLRVRPEAGDVTPWTEHLAWLIPDPRDRESFSDWLAWNYQRPGEKITWAPILYSQSPGVGKTTVFNALAACMGEAQVSEPTQAELEDRFNDWCFGKLLVKIEELMSGDKYHVAEKLKPVVANPTLSIRRMHQTGFAVKNVANVCASTNHEQALPIDRGDRRWMLIQCVEAGTAERRPRMKRFHRWLEGEGHAGIARWLNERDVSRFAPKGEAPATELKRLVAEATMTDFERAVELCDAFDRAPIISSAMVSEYLTQNGCQINERKLGLIASRRKWTSLPDQDGRVRIGNRKVTFWTSQEKGLLKLTAFMAKKPGERDRAHSNLLAKLVFGDEVKDDEVL